MSRPLERIYLTPVTKGNSSLQEDPGIQMDANTRTFRKICHPVLLLSQHQSEKKHPNPTFSTQAHGWGQLRKDFCQH